MKYDVIIVGAGPAGLIAGRTLNKKCNFLIIDSKKEIGLPLQCGEGIRKEIIDSFFKEKRFIKNFVDKHEIKTRNYKRVERYPYYRIDREKFEKFLARDIKDKIVLNTKLIDVNIKENHAEVITNKKKFICDLVIIAYGANYKIQKKFSLVKKRINLMPCYGGIYDNCKSDPTKFIFDFYPDKGVFWVFPENSTRANVGISTPKKSIKKEFLSILKSYPGLKDAKAIKNFSGIFPCSGPIKRTYHDRMLLCGDAAGFVYAGTGEGISYALKSGKIAADIALNAIKTKGFDKNYLKIYEKGWKKQFGKELKGGIIFYDLLMFACKYNILKRLFKAPTSKEFKDIIKKGGFPPRAQLAWWIIKLFHL